MKTFISHLTFSKLFLTEPANSEDIPLLPVPQSPKPSVVKCNKDDDMKLIDDPFSLGVIKYYRKRQITPLNKMPEAHKNTNPSIHTECHAKGCKWLKDEEEKSEESLSHAERRFGSLCSSSI